MLFSPARTLSFLRHKCTEFSPQSFCIVGFVLAAEKVSVSDSVIILPHILAVQCANDMYFRFSSLLLLLLCVNCSETHYLFAKSLSRTN